MSAHFQSSHHGGSHYLSSHFGRGQIIVPPPDFTPEPTFPPGTSEDAEARWRRIALEDELIMFVIQTWLTLKDRE